MNSRCRAKGMPTSGLGWVKTFAAVNLAAVLTDIIIGYQAIAQTAPPQQKVETPAPLAASGHPGWIKARARECYVWDWQPVAGETVTWSGECAKGLADGYGAEKWFDGSGAPGNQIQGNFSKGLPVGEVTVNYPVGGTYVGTLNSAGNREGLGKLTYPTGLSDTGYFWANEFIGPKPRDMADLVALRAEEQAAFRVKDFTKEKTTIEQELAIQQGLVGAENIWVADSYSKLASIFLTLEDFVSSEKMALLAISLKERYFGTTDGTLFYDRIILGISYERQYKFDKAENIYNRALAMVEGDVEKYSDYAATAYGHLGGLYIDQKRFSDAERVLKQALAIREKTLGPDHPYVAIISEGLARTYLDQGRYADAEQFYKRSLSIEEKAYGRDNPNTANSLEGLAHVYHAEARDAEAVTFERRVLEIHEKTVGPNHPEFAISLGNLAVDYEEQGRYAEAEPLFKRALAILEKALGPNHPLVANMLDRFAVHYFVIGRYSEAEQLYQRSLSIREQKLGSFDPDIAESLCHLALIYVAQNRGADAERLYKRSLAIRERSLGPEHIAVAETLNDLAGLYRSQDRFAEAEPLYRRSVAILEKALGPDNPDVAVVLREFGDLQIQQGRYDAAEPLLKRSLAILEKTLGANNPKTSQLYRDIGTLYVIRGRYADAEPLLTHSLHIREQAFGSNSPDVENVQNQLLYMYYRQGRDVKALAILDQLLANKSVNWVVGYETLFSAQEAKLRSPKQTLSDSFQIFQFQSSATSVAVQKLSLRLAASNSSLETLIRRLQDLDLDRVRLEKNLIDAFSRSPDRRNAQQEAQMRDQLADISEQRQSAQASIARQFPDYAALAQPEPVTIAECQSMLDDDEAVVAFYIGAEKSYAWTVTKTDGFWTEIPTNEKRLNRDVQQLRSSLTFDAEKPFDTSLAYQIYRETFGPIAEHITGKKRLSVIANGALTSIPLGVLITSDPQGKSLKDADWLIKSAAVTMEPSVFSLKTMRKKDRLPEAPRPLIAFADPVFSQSAKSRGQETHLILRSMPDFYVGNRIDVKALGDALPELPGTRSEVEAVARSVNADKNDLKFGQDASVTTVEHAPLDQYRVVYFATHALVAGDLKKFAQARAEPALVLTIPKNPTAWDDGLLRASDIAQLKLNADWAVLSACNTASSEGNGAEALSGLAQAFIYAGARSLIVSHWDVDDAAAAKLMGDLFSISATQPTMSHGEALQAAELAWLISAKTDEETHPRYWAPFSVIGEPAKGR